MNKNLSNLFMNSKTYSSKVGYLIKSYSWISTIGLFLIIFVLVFDLIYSNTHFVDVYESLNDRYYHSSPDKNNYIELASFNDVQFVNITPNPIDKKNVSIKNQTTYDYRIEFRFNEDGELPVGSEITYIYPDGSKEKYRVLAPEPYNIWDSKSDEKIITNPVLIGEGSIFNANYIFVVDDQNQLWLEQYSKFTSNSPKILLKTQNHLSNIFLFSDKLNENEKSKITDFYVNLQQDREGSTFLFFEPIDSHHVVLYQKEKDQVRSILLQLIQIRNHSYPVILWDEVEKVRKPLHLTSYLYNKFKEIVSK